MGLAEKLSIINHYRRADPPIDVEGLAKALGLTVHYAHLPDGLSGMLAPADKSYVITVNASDPATRQRFTIAHEIGHFLFHEILIGDGLDDDRAYRSTQSGRYRNTAIGPAEETEANKFAASTLMPHEVVEKMVEKMKPEGRNHPRDLARLFGVSEHAMSIRLGVPYGVAG